MPAALDVDREAVRTLALDIGVREAARQMGLPENTVVAWSARDGWFEKPRLPPTMIQPASGAIKPSQAMANILESRKQQTRANLTKYLVNGSKVAAKSRSPLADAPLVKALVGVMQGVWPEQTTPGVSINILNSSGGMG